jgi:hypothetical protein
MPLTLEDKLAYAAESAREKEAEKHFFDEAQPFFPRGFSVCYRGEGCHWDVMANQVPGRVSAWLAAHPGSTTTGSDGGAERAFAIRGERGAIIVRDERWDPHRPHPREPIRVKSVTMAMMWIVEELMQVPEDDFIKA